MGLSYEVINRFQAFAFKCNLYRYSAALLRNPAGNADQQTPLVLIRHDPARRAQLVAAAAADEKARKERERNGVAFVQK